MKESLPSKQQCSTDSVVLKELLAGTCHASSHFCTHISRGDRKLDAIIFGYMYYYLVRSPGKFRESQIQASLISVTIMSKIFATYPN